MWIVNVLMYYCECLILCWIGWRKMKLQLLYNRPLLCLLFTYSYGCKISVHHFESIQVLYLRIKHQSYKYTLQIRICCRYCVAVSYTDEDCYFKLQKNQSWGSCHQEFSAHKVSRAWVFLISVAWRWYLNIRLS